MNEIFCEFSEVKNGGRVIFSSFFIDFCVFFFFFGLFLLSRTRGRE